MLPNFVTVIHIINENDVVIAISQSGETVNTLAAVELAKIKRRNYHRRVQCGRFVHSAQHSRRFLHPCRP